MSTPSAIVAPPRLAPLDPELVAALRAAGLSLGLRATDRLAAAHDASHYLLTPQVVVTARNAAEVGAAIAVGRRTGFPVTFRSGGTSLSGQSGSEGILIDTRKHFRTIDVSDGGRRVRCGPGATVRAVNGRLLRHFRKLGPDPASEIACTIGGVVANNSSGMSCGTHANSYRTLLSTILVLPSGTVVDTGRPGADDRLRADEPALHAGLEHLRERIRSNPESVATLERLHAIKNTMGYGLNSFLDHDAPANILERLVVGSEGTLAFVAEATFTTVAVKPHVATGLLIFPHLAAATASLPDLVSAGFATIELLDATSLRVSQRDPDATPELLRIAVEDHAALLVEFQEETVEALEARLTGAGVVLADLPLSVAAELTSDPVSRAGLWKIRKGLFTAVAGNRPPGTTALLEDIAVPVANLLDTCTGLVALFEAHGYEDSVIFGHAKDGNVHFMLNERFDHPASRTRYVSFTEEMVELVLAQGGTLKAEHGTGRIMAPFVARQYGDELYDIMCDLKELVDPDGVLNPGVLISRDPEAHMHHLKLVQTVEEEVDRCVECGYCEPVCPSKDLTLTPRERIVLRREMVLAEKMGDRPLLKELRQEFEYDGIQTCAVDGMCETACPVLINTGDLVRRLRSENQKGTLEAGWRFAAGHWDAVSTMGGKALSVADALPGALPVLATKVARTVLDHDLMPLYGAELPSGGSRRPRLDQPDPVAVYFSSCTTTMFGPTDGGDGVAVAFQELCERVGISLVTPKDLPSLCCGTPWKSKGLKEGYARMQDKVVASLRSATRDGELPVVCDASSCTEGLVVLLEAAAAGTIHVVDAVAFVDEHVLPLLPEGNRVASLTLHPTCSSTRLGIDGALTRVAGAAADAVVIPDEWGCCAFAGDRGLLHPELTASATTREAAEVKSVASSAHASLNRTCELGMSRSTGQPYQHVLETLNATFPSS